MVELLRKRTEVPIYSFKEHQRLPKTSPVYSVRVLILEGIFALYDPRVKELLDIKVVTCYYLSACVLRLTSTDLCGGGCRHLSGEAK